MAGGEGMPGTVGRCGRSELRAVSSEKRGSGKVDGVGRWWVIVAGLGGSVRRGSGFCGGFGGRVG